MLQETDVFKAKFLQRIAMIRPKIAVNVASQMKGRNYNSESWAYEGVVGAVLVSANKDKTVPDNMYAKGLTLSPGLIDAGNFDRLIIDILSRLATIDFHLENSLELH